ncbi:hypothetical protein GQ44DRAFT_714238 [Phaeosphaeriaceae sp. PMI808]|nr:hypothetical protein GQ44DRAFT_714238 [Phaeosphaeriaceae sp. PMI808]
MIYDYTYDKRKQALLVHRPRIASLRPRTRLDRSRTLSSDVKDRELGTELATTERSKKAAVNSALARDNNRPFFGLTQVCRQIRAEYRPIYLLMQEVGMDLTEVVSYLMTFYSNAPEEVKKLVVAGANRVDMPFMGNLTIAIGEKVTKMECGVEGVEVLPLLDLWANSIKVEAGFGRYVKARYIPQTDGEAKDLYRLFGRRVLPNRQCTPMNSLWRTILRSGSLVSVTIHRKPPRLPLAAISEACGVVNPPPLPSQDPKPCILILFRPNAAELWMRGSVRWYTTPPAPPNWLSAHGFAGMEHFDVRVGAWYWRPGFPRVNTCA